MPPPYILEDYVKIELTNNEESYEVGKNIGTLFITESTTLFSTVDCWIRFGLIESFVIAGFPLNKEMETGKLDKIRKADGQPDGILHIWMEGRLKR